MPKDSPEQSYFPGAAARLIVRFDEFGKASRLPPAPKKTTKNLVGAAVDRGNLQAVPDGNGGWAIVPKGSLPPVDGAPGARASSVFDALSSPDGLTHSVVVLPREADWSQNGPRTADQLKITMRYADCPVDPRTIRSCAVEFRLGCFREDDFASTAHGRRGLGDDGPLGRTGALNVLPESYTGPRGEQRTNLRFRGFVDKWTVEVGGGKEPSISLECTDLTRLLIDQEVGPKNTLDLAKPVDQAIAQFLAQFPQFYGMSVQYRPAGQQAPVQKKVLQNTAHVPRIGPQQAQGGAGSNKLSAWDYLTDVCGSIGHAVFLDGLTVVVQQLRTLTSSSFIGRPDDPFGTRRLQDSGERLDVRRFIYGRNVEEMRISRNFARHAPTNVEVRVYDPGAKTTLVARFPEAPDRLKYAIPGAAQPDQKWTVIRVQGIRDGKTLRAIAQSYYESVGRNELSVEVKTRNLASFGAGNADPDILDMRPGDSFELLVDRSQGDPSTINEVERALKTGSQNAALMKALGFSDAFAQAYAQAYNDAGFLSVFRLKQLRVNWSTEEGVQLTLNGCNYIEARMDKTAGADEPVPDGSKPNAPQGVAPP